jgi:cell wall-associated NlpC family hydrolase
VPPGGTLPLSSPPAVKNLPAGLNPKIQKVLAFALAQVGKPYVAYQAGPNGYDCSGLTMAAYAEIGVSLPHYSAAQATYGIAIDRTTQQIQPGDLIFLESSPGSGIIHHVGMAVSATQWVQAPRTGEFVHVGPIPFNRVVAVRRLVTG